MPDARAAILGRLKAASGERPAAHAERLASPPPMPARSWTPSERLARLVKNLEAARAEVLFATPSEWPAAVRAFLISAKAKTLAYGPASPIGPALAAHWPEGEPSLVAYDRPIEELKARLFGEIDAGITSTLGGIAETGSLVLAPSAEEPRLLSLVPPIHLALLDPARLWNTLAEALAELGWAQRPPPNGLLVSGPSKTADIEQTLAYGVHGPKRLVVVVLKAP